MGKSPVYRLGYKTIPYDIPLSRFLNQVGVPHWAPGITYMDLYDAYIMKAQSFTSFQKWQRTAFKSVYISSVLL